MKSNGLHLLKTKMLKTINYTFVFYLFILMPIISSEPLSCYRARCTHCAVEFISKICPSVCNSCPYIFQTQAILARPKIRPGRPNHFSENQVSARVHGASITNNAPSLPSQNTQYLVDTQSKRVSIPLAQQLPNENYVKQNEQPQNVYTYQIIQQPQAGQNFNQGSQPLALNQQIQQPQTTSFGSSYATNYQNNIPNSQVFNQQHVPLFQQQQQFVQPQNPFNLPAQPQPQNPFDLSTQHQSQSQISQRQYNLPAQPTTASAAPFNFFQPQRSLFFNPFQPFLQQTLQAQQQPQPLFQTFTSYQQSITPAPVQQPQPTESEKSNLGASPSASSLSTYSQQQVQPVFQQQSILQPNQQFLNQQQPQYANVQNTQFPAQPYVYQQQKQQPQTQSNVYNVLVPQPVKQQKLPPGNVVAPSIDTAPVYINKKIYEEKSGGHYAKCPKQPNWEPCVSKDFANERYRNCCQRLGEGCAQICSYDQTLATIQLAVLTGRCPISKVADMMICASGNEDATPCCQAYNVFEPGFEHCRPYCNPAAGLPNDGMLAEKYRCLGKLSQIQNCFYVSQKP